MIALDKDQWYYLDELTAEQLREVAAAILTDIDSRTLWTKGDKDPVSTLESCLNTKRLLFYSNAGGYKSWLYHPKSYKVEAGDFTNAKSLFAVNNIEFKNKRICII
mgnify:FL=1